MNHVAALVLNRALQERLHAAFAGRHRLHLARDPDQLWASLRSHPATLVVVEPTAGIDLPALVRAVRTRYPGVAVVAYCHVRRGLSGDVVDLVRAGVHDLVLAGVDDDRLALAGLVAHAAGRSTADDVLERVAPLGLPQAAVDLLRQLLEAAGRPLTIRTTASALGVHRRTLLKRLIGAALPGPRELAGWCRLLVAARLLEDPTSSVERTAHDLEFPSANALRNLLHRRAGLSPTALRDRGGYAYLRTQFLAALTPGAAGPARGAPPARAGPMSHAAAARGEHAARPAADLA